MGHLTDRMRYASGVWYIGQRTSLYLDDDLHAAVKACGVPLAELIRRGLASSVQPAQVANEPSVTATAAIAITGGEPSPGVACAGLGCWQRNTSRYGLRRLVLCTACAAALQGQEYKRQPPEAATRVLRRGAA